MDTKQKNEKLQFIMQRYDSYYSAIGIKGNTYLTINGAILGGLMTGYFTSDRVGEELTLVVVSTLICNFSAIVNILIALQPFVGKVDNQEYTSAFSVALESKRQCYKEEVWNEMDEEKWNRDLKEQAGIYARGMKRKFDALSRATWLMGAQVLGVIVFALGMLVLRTGLLG